MCFTIVRQAKATSKKGEEERDDHESPTDGRSRLIRFSRLRTKDRPVEELFLFTVQSSELRRRRRRSECDDDVYSHAQDFVGEAFARVNVV